MKLILTYNLKYDFAVNIEKYFLFKKKKKKIKFDNTIKFYTKTIGKMKQFERSYII